MKTFKEILIIFSAPILMIWGLSIILNADPLNAILFLGLGLIGTGFGLLMYLLRKYMKEKE